MDVLKFINIGGAFEFFINWLTDNFGPFFDGVSDVIGAVIGVLQAVLLFPHPVVMILILSTLAFFVAKKSVVIFSVIGFLLIVHMGLWDATMDTLSLVIASVIIAILIGIPLGIWASKNDTVDKIVHPILDFMQTLPAFVYLIPAILLFNLGAVPGVISTLMFAIPPVVRLTNLGIRQVPDEIRESCKSFGASPFQMLVKAELPVAMPTIMAGVNQTIMLALSMVVIAGMIGAGGLGNEVLKGISQLRIDIGFESGIAIVILAIYLDRVTQALGKHK